MSDTENSNVETNKANWGAIILDMVIIVFIMACLAGLCNLLMKPFESISRTDELVSLIHKGDSKGGLEDAPFLKELREGQAGDTSFVNTQDNTGRTPLMWASYANFNNPVPAQKKDLQRLYYVRALLATPGIDLHMTDKDGFTALHWAAWSGMPLTSLLLADAGLNINAQDNNGYTPLMLAAMRGNDEVAAILMALGARAELTNVAGETAAQLVTGAEGAYNKRASWMYTLIFSPEREAAYRETMKLQQTHPAPATAAELVAKLTTHDALAARLQALNVEEKAQEAEAQPAAPSATPAAEAEETKADPV